MIKIERRSMECNKQEDSNTENLYDGLGSQFEYTGKPSKRLN